MPSLFRRETRSTGAEHDREPGTPPQESITATPPRGRGAVIEALLDDPATTRESPTDAPFDEPLGFPPYPRGTLSMGSSVLAIIPHYRCERWLESCLTSMAGQTRPLQATVVIDDGSGEPPVEIVQRFPDVTLLESHENAGPYRLIQEVINRTHYDAYLFQDADDWSTPDRLELLLAEAERSGAELVGCQDVWVMSEEGEALTFAFPLDVNAALAVHPASTPLHHGTSLVSRDLVMRVGGFATGLRYNGDTEFLRRAAHLARVVNIPQFCYFYRNRKGSLTSDPETGLLSAGRKEVLARQRERAELNAERVKQGEEPLLEPMAVAPSTPLRHITGPTLDIDWTRATAGTEHPIVQEPSGR